MNNQQTSLRMTPTQLEKRFHDLLVKDIKGETSPSEKKKLAILERMRAGPVTDSEKKQIARLDWSTRELKKIMGRLLGTKGTILPESK